MVGRRLTGPEQRAVDARDRNIAALVRTFKDAVEGDSMRAPQPLREEALTGMWEFSRVRGKIPGAVRDLADYIDRFDPPREDYQFNLKILRIAMALYLMDKMGEISKTVAADGGFKMTALFAAARTAVGRLLDEHYFEKSHDEIIDGYLDAEPTLTAIACVSRTFLPALSDAMKRYRQTVADMMPEGPMDPIPEPMHAAR